MEDEFELENGLQPHLAVIVTANVLHNVGGAPIPARIFQDLHCWSRIWALPLDVALPSDEQVACT